MRHKRYVIFLALGLLHCLGVGPTLAVIGDSAAGVPEVRLPVTPPPAPAGVRQIHLSAMPSPPPPPPAMLEPVGIPTPSRLTPPVFAETLFLPQDPARGPVGMSSSGPEVRMGVPQPGEPDLLGVQPPPVPSAPQLPPADPDQWQLSADRVIGQHDSEYVQAVGNARLVQGLRSLKADFMRYYKASRWVVLKGNVRVIWDGDVLEAEEAEFDLGNMIGWLKRGKVFVGKSHIYFQSDYVRKYAASSYRFQNAKITACDSEKPAWSFLADEGDINIDGRTKLWHSSFRVGDTPVAYSPYLSLPGGAKRQSGLLVPEISQSRQRGVSVNQAYYWAMDDERDLTFYEYGMSRRGLMQGLEYRHAENPSTKGDWRVDFLHDRKSDRNRAQEELYLQSDGLQRPNLNRWWLRSKYNGFIADPAWALKLDLDAVSDQNYLREFGGTASGYDLSRRNFLKEFGRDIDVADSLTRTSTAMLSRSWDRYGMAAKVAWTQNLAYRNGNNPASRNPTTQSLPELNLYAFKDSVFGTPLEWEASSQASYFWREYGTRALRTDLRPTLSLPLPLGPVTLIPRAGLRNTAYSVSGYANEPAGTTRNKTPARTFPELGFSAFTEFSRVFGLSSGSLLPLTENVGKSEWGAVRHSVIPRLDFAYVPAPQSQTRLPVFDSLDRVKRQNTITYSLTNVFDRKRTSVVAGTDGNATIATTGTDYLDFLRLRLEQSYDRDEAARGDQLGTYARRPYSDLMLEATVKPEKHLALTSKTFYSPYLGRPTEHEHLLTLTKEKLGELRFGHDYLYPLNEYKRRRTKDIQALRVGADVNITDKLKLTAEYRLDIAGHSDLEKTVGLTWREQCYDVQLLFSRKPSDQSIELRFNLLDFGKP